MDDEEYLQPVLTSQEEHFHKLDTVLITFIPLIFGVSINFSDKINNNNNNNNKYYMYI